MRWLILFVALMILPAVFAVDYSEDTMLYWKFDNTGTEETDHTLCGAGNNLSCEFLVNASYTFATAKLSQGINIYDQVLGLNSTPLDFAGFKTYDFWVYMNTSQPQMTNMLNLTVSGNDDLIVKLHNNYTYTINAYTEGNNETCTKYGLFAGNITQNAWNHMVLTFNGSLATVYANGNLVSSFACEAVFTDASVSFTIGDQDMNRIDNLILINDTYKAGDAEASYNSGDGTVFNVSCSPNYVCIGYDACVAPDTEVNCSAIQDLNNCPPYYYDGDYSEFTPEPCVYNTYVMNTIIGLFALALFLSFVAGFVGKESAIFKILFYIIIICMALAALLLLTT